MGSLSFAPRGWQQEAFPCNYLIELPSVASLEATRSRLILRPSTEEFARAAIHDRSKSVPPPHVGLKPSVSRHWRSWWRPVMSDTTEKGANDVSKIVNEYSAAIRGSLDYLTHAIECGTHLNAAKKEVGKRDWEEFCG